MKLKDVLDLLPELRCDRCKHWLEGTDKGECLLAETAYGDPKFPDTPMAAVDSEEYHAYFMTKPDFFCKAFEAK